MQDEVHRYTITYHRTIRSRGSISSVLDGIPKVGVKRKKDLIKAFGSVAKMEQASVEELSKVVPREVAETVSDYLRSRSKKNS